LVLIKMVETNTKPLVLITGVTGFLGMYIVREFI
jgi:nucleoside-diphosphate-sugar epimerase